MRPLDFNDIAISRRKLLRGSALFGAGAAMGAMPGFLSAQEAAARWPNLARFIADYVDSGRVANIVLSLGMGDADPEFISGGTLSLGGFTKADGDSLYRIYSMTKPITGIAATMLIDDGKLSLDQPLYEILPAFRDMKVQKVYDGGIGPDDLEPAASPITIRQLMTHTSGLGYSIIQQGPIQKAYTEAGLVPGQVTKIPAAAIFGRGDTVRSLETFADRLATMPLVAQPGTRWSYSVGLDLLGRVIEVASGMSFDAFLQSRIFDPCGMTSTWFRVPASEVGRLTTNYGVVNGNLLPIDPAAGSVYRDDPAFPFGGAGLVSSPRDYDRFQQMLLGFGVIDGTRVMSEPAVRLATSPMLSTDIDMAGTFAAGANFGAGGRVGLGADAGSFGWGGAAGTLSSVYYGRNMRMGLYTQYMPANAYDMMPQVQAALAADLAAMAR
ncbi:serine hydrolase domain-containing protein [Altererythrobacter sp. CAU 1778]